VSQCEEQMLHANEVGLSAASFLLGPDNDDFAV
jgi:hypothetical protein